MAQISTDIKTLKNVKDHWFDYHRSLLIVKPIKGAMIKYFSTLHCDEFVQDGNVIKYAGKLVPCNIIIKGSLSNAI